MLLELSYFYDPLEVHEVDCGFVGDVPTEDSEYLSTSMVEISYTKWDQEIPMNRI